MNISIRSGACPLDSTPLDRTTDRTTEGTGMHHQGTTAIRDFSFCPPIAKESLTLEVAVKGIGKFNFSVS
nr:MAG TPA: hypothetical protein [Caudoviricetes sp.]